MPADEEAVVIAFRQHTLLPLDDCLYALQPTIPHLTRSTLHRCFVRHGISRLPDADGDKPQRSKFKRYPIGFFHIDIAEVRTEQGKPYLLVAIDRTSKFAFVQLHEKATRRIAGDFLRALAAAVPYKITIVLTDNVLCGEAALGFGQQVSSRRQRADVGSKLIQMVSTVNGIAPSHSKHRIQRRRCCRGPHRP